MIIEERGMTTEGYEYIIGVHSKFGHRMGYVGVYPGNPLFGEQYAGKEEEDYTSSLEYHIHVHGGLNFSGRLAENIIGGFNPFYFGFDCGHLDDAKIPPTEMHKIFTKAYSDKSISEIQTITNSYTMLYNMGLGIDTPNAIVRDKNYVLNECYHLSSQLKELEAEYGNV